MKNNYFCFLALVLALAVNSGPTLVAAEDEPEIGLETEPEIEPEVEPMIELEADPEIERETSPVVEAGLPPPTKADGEVPMDPPKAVSAPYIPDAEFDAAVASAVLALDIEAGKAAAASAAAMQAKTKAGEAAVAALRREHKTALAARKQAAKDEIARLQEELSEFIETSTKIMEEAVAAEQAGAAVVKAEAAAQAARFVADIAAQPKSPQEAFDQGWKNVTDEAVTVTINGVEQRGAYTGLVDAAGAPHGSRGTFTEKAESKATRGAIQASSWFGGPKSDDRAADQASSHTGSHTGGWFRGRAATALPCVAVLSGVQEVGTFTGAVRPPWGSDLVTKGGTAATETETKMKICRPHGTGTFTVTEGAHAGFSFEGGWVDGSHTSELATWRFEGHGDTQLAYVGAVVRGERDGKGTSYFRDGRVAQAGTWKASRFLGGA